MLLIGCWCWLGCGTAPYWAGLGILVWPAPSGGANLTCWTGGPGGPGGPGALAGNPLLLPNLVRPWLGIRERVWDRWGALG